MTNTRSGQWVGLVARRLVTGVLTVLGVATCVFFAISLLPGDPVDQILGDDAPPEARTELRARLDLDKPVLERYGLYLKGLATGRLGTSFRHTDRSVGSLLAEAFPHTLALALASMLVAVGLGVPLGVLAAVGRNHPVSSALDVAALLGLAVPNIWLGPILLVVFSIGLGLTPLPGDDPNHPAGLVLPAFTLGTALMAILFRLTRTSMEDILDRPFVRTARAKGLAPSSVVFRHALPNALLPVVSVGGLQLGVFLNETAITEKIFERPGLGSLFLESYYSRDIPAVQGCVLLMATTYVVVNALTDATYLLLDPRLRHSRGGGGES